MSSPSATSNTYPYPNEPTWSRSEKAIARKVFDAALKRELHQVMQKTKQKANQIKEPVEVWELERFLTQRRTHGSPFRGSKDCAALHSSVV